MIANLPTSSDPTIIRLINSANFHPWKKSLKAYMASKGVANSEYGLSDKVFTTREWFFIFAPQQLHDYDTALLVVPIIIDPNIQVAMDASGVPARVVVPHNVPVLPGNIQSVHAHAIKAQYEQDIYLMKELRDAKQALIASLPQEMVQNLTDPQLGSIRVTIEQIIARVTLEYGQINETDIVGLITELNQPIQPSEDQTRSVNFQTHYNNMLRIIEILQTDADTAPNRTSKLTYLHNAVANNHVELHAWQLYMQKTQDAPHQRTLEAAATFILQSLRNAPLEEDDPVLLANAVQQAQSGRHQAKTVKASQAKDRGRRDHQRGGRGAVADTTQPWCYIHGHRGHDSSKCNVMRFDSKFTSARRLAKKSDVENKTVPEYKRPDQP